MYWNSDRAPFQEPPGDEPANPAEDSWLDEFSRFPRRRDLLPGWAPPASLIDARRQADQRMNQLRAQQVPPPAHLAPLATAGEWTSVFATAADVVQARLGRRRYPDLLNPTQRDRWPEVLAEPERQSVEETFYWGNWSELTLWQTMAPILRLPDPHGARQLDPRDPPDPASPVSVDVSHRVHDVAAEYVRHQLVSRRTRSQA